jgi:hypothetical protein
MKIRALTLLLPALLAPACYRATGFERPALMAEEIPAVGGDRVGGMKAMAGAGDYYVGNDFVGLAVDGSPAGSGIAGAPGGGGIVDVGFIMLDSSYRRVPAPCDMLDRMATVVNQDPDVQLVFDEFQAVTEPGVAILKMKGRVHDPKRKISGVSEWPDGFARGLAAEASISLGPMDRHYTIETSITNESGSDVGVLSIGDCVFQRGGGFRVLAPVWGDYGGALVHSWGVDMPGTDFLSDPMRGSVRSGPVVLMGTEPGSDALDCHVSLGLMPLGGQDGFLVASDRQASLADTRPIFPERFIAGRLPDEDQGRLAHGGTLTHARRLYVKGGPSGSLEYLTAIYTAGVPNQGTGLLNDMRVAMASLRGEKVATLRFWLEGSAARQTPVPTELRFERYVGDGDPASDGEPSRWRLERLEWMEPADSLQQLVAYDSSGRGVALAATPDAYFGVFLPPGAYRIVAVGPSHRTVFQVGTDMTSDVRPNTQAAIELQASTVFSLAERLSPEYDDTHRSDYGSRTSVALRDYSISTRGNDSPAAFVQPMRFEFLGRDDAPAPGFMRRRSITSTFDANTKSPRLPGPPYLPSVVPPGSYHFLGGSSAFGVQMEPASTPLIVPLVPGVYDVYGARGPLSALERFTADARTVSGDSGRLLTVFQPGTPEDAWLALDLPGPSMATTGGALPCEQLASALADGVDVVCMVEADHQRDPLALHREFKASLSYNYDANWAVGVFPLVVGGRQSDLEGPEGPDGPGFGTATALFTTADPAARLGGARPSKGWSLADFMAQADGQFNVVNRPRGPRGLFELQGFDPLGPLPRWWGEAGPHSLGLKNGDFDAMEIMSCGALTEQGGVDAWWREFGKARQDWFSIIARQSPEFFTKALGFSGGRLTQDTPVGLARTWIYVGRYGGGMSWLDAYADEWGYPMLRDRYLAALKSGAAVASTGPFVLGRVMSGASGGGDGDADAVAIGPGGLALVGGQPSSIALQLTLVAPDWVPVDEIRVVVNGVLAYTLPDPKNIADPKNPLARPDEDSPHYKDSRYYVGTVQVPLAGVCDAGDAWLVVEAGAPLETSGPYRPIFAAEADGWNAMMKGIYPVAVANPVFLDLDGDGKYTPPGM